MDETAPVDETAPDDETAPADETPGEDEASGAERVPATTRRSGWPGENSRAQWLSSIAYRWAPGSAWP